MKKNELKKIIQSNGEKLPISYNKLVFKDFSKNKKSNKITLSSKFKDSEYELAKFYKEITRF
jgi:hypothetical protein